MAATPPPARPDADHLLPGRRRHVRPGRPQRHLEAGARPRPPGRSPDHPDRRGQTRPTRPSRRRAGSSTSASTPRASSRPRSRRSGQVHRRRDPGLHREPSRDRGAGPASGPAAVPTRRLRRGCTGPVRHRRACRSVARRSLSTGKTTDKPGGRDEHRATRPTPRARPTRPTPTDRHHGPRGRGRGRRTHGRGPRSPGRPHRTRPRSRCSTSSSAPTPAPRVDDQRPGRRPTPAPQEDDPDQPLVACELGEDDGAATKYLLSRSVIEGTELDDASAGIPQGEVEWAVSLDLGNDKDKAHPKGSTGAEDDFETISSQLAGTGRQFAIVLDGIVLSAPMMNDPIPDGRSQITGNFTEESAHDLATSLKFGALPIAFEERRHHRGRSDRRWPATSCPPV